MSEHEYGFDDAADFAGAGGDAPEGAPALREQGEAAFSLHGAGPMVDHDHAWQRFRLTSRCPWHSHNPSRSAYWSAAAGAVEGLPAEYSAKISVRARRAF